MRLSPFGPTALTLALLSACGGGSPTDGGGGGGSADFTATVAGQAWAADQLTLQVIAGSVEIPGSLTISGTQVQSAANYRSLSLALGFIPGTGTFPLGVNNGTTPGGTGSVMTVSGATSVTSYLTPFSGSAGSITITTLTSTRMAGTFTYTAAPLLGGGTGVNVTNGAFDIDLPSGFVAATGNNRGSTISATIGGQPWVGATNLAVGGVGTFVVGGQNTERSINITPTVVVSPGTYPIGNGTQGVSVHVINAGTTNSWGPANGSTGTVTFTAVGAGRITGTFSGVLAPVGGTVGTLTVADGAFDIRTPGT